MNNLPYQENKLLFDINSKHNSNFNPSVLIDKQYLSHFLVSSLNKALKCEDSEMLLCTAEKTVVLEHTLNYDFYTFDIKPFMKLEYKSPKLFSAFATLVSEMNLSRVELFETPYLYEDSIDYALEDMPPKEKQAFSEHIDFIHSCYELIKAASCNSISEALTILANYTPRNKSFILIKETFQKWLSYDCTSFISQQPHSRFLDDNGDVIEVYNRVFFAYDTNSDLYNDYVKEHIDHWYNNCQLAQPCSYMDFDHKSIIKKEVETFEEFTLEYCDMIDTLNSI